MRTTRTTRPAGPSTDAPRPGIVRRVVSAALTTLIVVATVAGLAYLAPSVLGYERYAITGGSMSGSIEKYSLVLGKRVPVDQLAAGDVITYLPPPDSGVSTLVTHRIVDATTDEAGVRHFVTQGDANPDPDPWLFSLDEGTQPVVSHVVPHVGHVVIALADRETRMLLLGVPAALIALASLVELVRALLPAGPGRRRLDDGIVPEPPSVPAPGGRALPGSDHSRPSPAVPVLPEPAPA
ncbi:hypothetical protein GCM10009821_10750 [Aeromicrobium halocynthiae]|uniref:Signal peptidase I n=1 Tax=Aeromicrobium halocynthiae TaxID=560557 RepID=A0ABN2VVL1_9ACTN